MSTTRETTVYEVKMAGVPQLVASSKEAAASIDNLKRSAATPVGGTRGVAGLAQTEAQIKAMQAEAAALAGRAAANTRASEQQVAAAAAQARRRPAFGERGRAIATAAGAGRFAGLAAPFGGWGPLLGIGAGFTALSQVKAGIQNIGLNQQLTAQTIAGIKSTGGAANVSAVHIDKMSTSLSKLAGVSDESVHAAQNILLTFPSIRNEVGKGNKIFDQASLSVANVAARMHTDMPQAALQLGKALNDPIRGMGALRRIGVQFTKGQEDQIKVLVASGNKLGAQKIILQELNREFGGSAQAAGKTLPGALSRLSEAWEDARNRLVIKTLPALTRATNWLTTELPGAIDVTLTALSLFDTDPRSNALSRWFHRNFGGSKTGGVFDYLLSHSVDDVARDLIHDTNPSRARRLPGGQANPRFRGSGGAVDAQGLAERRRQQAAVGGIMLDEDGNPVKGMGSPFAQKPVKVHWDATDPFATRPVILVADGQQLAKVVTKQQQKRTHAEGTGTSRK